MVEAGILQVSSGVEIGKMAYGTGDIPFVRTSDIANWEIKTDPKQSVSEELYNKWASKCEVRPGDILMVRDGTYLIGTCAIVTEFDVPMLYQSHLFNIRVLDEDALNPYLLFALLNSEVVKEQIRSKQFTQDIIDTLGERVRELALPIPKDRKKQAQIADQIKRIVLGRAKLRHESTKIVSGMIE